MYMRGNSVDSNSFNYPCLIAGIHVIQSSAVDDIQHLSDNCDTCWVSHQLKSPLLSATLFCFSTADLLTDLQGGPKKRIPSFIFGITSVIQHRF